MMRKRRKLHKDNSMFNKRLIIGIILLLLCLLAYFFSKRAVEQGEIFNATQTTTTTTPFQENVSIEVPEGVVKIGKRGRIEVV